MTKSTKHRARKTSTAKTDDTTLPGFLAQFRRYLPIALRIPDADVRVPRINLNAGVLNASAGVTALAGHRDVIATIPGISLEQIDSLEPLGQALLYAAGQVDRIVPITGEVRAMLDTASQIRTTLLAKADVLVLDGIVPATVVAGIRKGRGALDSAGDCVALAALFHDYLARLDGHVKVTTDDIQAANDIGGKLLAVLRPEIALPAVAKETDAAADARDRLWTLFEQTWEHHVWRAGAYVFGRDVDDHVPPLGARSVKRRAPQPTPVPQPTPDPAPPAPIEDAARHPSK